MNWSASHSWAAIAAVPFMCMSRKRMLPMFSCNPETTRELSPKSCRVPSSLSCWTLADCVTLLCKGRNLSGVGVHYDVRNYANPGHNVKVHNRQRVINLCRLVLHKIYCKIQHNLGTNNNVARTEVQWIVIKVEAGLQTLICSRSCQMVNAPLLMSFCPMLSPARSATLMGRPLRAKNWSVFRQERTSHSVCSHRRVKACKQPQTPSSSWAHDNVLLPQHSLTGTYMDRQTEIVNT